MSPKVLLLALGAAALGAAEVGDHVFPFSMPDAGGSAPLAYSDATRFNHHCFAFVYAAFDKKHKVRDENNRAFLERALPLCNGLLPQTECLFSLSELFKIREGHGAKGTKKEWCQGLYEKVAGVAMSDVPSTTTTASVARPQVQRRVKSTTSQALAPRLKSTTAAPKVKSTTAAATPRVKSTTTPSAPLIKSTTTLFAPRIKSQPRVKSTAAPTTTGTTTTTTATTTATTTSTTTTSTTTTSATTATTTSTTTTTTADVAAKRSVKAGVDFMKHLRSPVAPLGSRAAAPAVLTKSSTSTTTTTSTTTVAAARPAKASLNAGVDFMRHLRTARALVAKASTTTTSSWPATDVECVCWHRDGKRTCNCPEGKTPPPEGRIQGRLLAAAAEAHTPSPQLMPEQVIEAEKRESALGSLENVFGTATKAARSMFGSFMQRM